MCNTEINFSEQPCQEWKCPVPVLSGAVATGHVWPVGHLEYD